ncbi:ABC transporter substrate-binding protein [Rhodococcus koreensis]|uniref:ABC transporter substrate-binding protein n=1 Tax=Rhodococcus koreensis TaxID=99653 RepID=UPI003671540C
MLRTRRSPRATIAVLGSALLVSTVLASCGSDDAGDGESGPIKIMTVGPFTSGATAAFDELRAAAEAGTAEVNAAGGVDGRDIELVTCDDQLNPDVAQSCFQKAAADKGVVAVVGGYNVFPEVIAPYLQQSGLVVVGGTGSGEAAMANPNMFPQNPGTPNQYYGAAADALRKGAKKILLLAVDLPGTIGLGQALEEAVSEGGGEYLDPVLISAAEANTAAAADKVVAAKPDAVILALSPLQTTSSIEQMRQKGFGAPIYVQTSLSDQASLDAMGGFDKLVGFQGMPPFTDNSVPGIKQFNDAMDEHEPDSPRNELAVSTWYGVHAFAQIAESIDGPITRKSVSDAVRSTSTLDTFGLTPDVPGWYTAEAPYPAHSAVHNNHIVITSLAGGELTWDKVFYPALGGGEATPAQ